MVVFNTANLRKVVSLSQINPYADKIEVKDATYDGDTYLEGMVSLNGDAMMFGHLKHFEQLLKDVWPKTFIQIGACNKKPVLFVYDSMDLF
jgi:hypothetical protein